MAEARNYEEYRRQVLDKLGVEYYDEDIQEFDRWRLKVLQGLKDLYGEENIITAINAWLDEHTINFDGATASEEGVAGLVPPTSLGMKRQARAHYHLNAEGDWVVDPVWNAYGSGYGGTEKVTIKYPNSTGTAGVNIEAIGTGQKGVANGVAPLDGDGKVDGSYLPISNRTTYGLIKTWANGDPPTFHLDITHNNANGNLEETHSVPILDADGYVRSRNLAPSCRSLYKKILKTLTTDNDTLYNHNRTVTVYYDGDTLPTVKLYNEEQTSYGYDRRWVYEANEVMVYTTNDHSEYGEHKAKFWFIPRASSNLKRLTNGSQMICEHNANYAEGGNIEH